jgi:septal ring factor EnvC (AmiA/AmiB activator)
MAPAKKGMKKARKPRVVSPQLIKARQRIRGLLNEKDELIDELKKLEVESGDHHQAFAYEVNERKRIEGWYNEEKRKALALAAEVSRLSRELDACKSDSAMLLRLLREAKEELDVVVT